MHKLVKLLIGIFIVVLVLIAGLGISGYLLKDKIIGRVVSELNQYINAPISVDKVSFSLIRNFPKASVSFSNLNASSSNSIRTSDFKNLDAQKLLQVNKIDFAFDALSIFKNKLDINELIISNGVIQLLIDEEGNDNFHIINIPQSNDTTSQQISINLKKLQLLNTQIVLINKKKETELVLFSKDFGAKGSKGNSGLQVSTAGELRLESLKTGALQYAPQSPAQLELKFDYKNDTLLLHQGQLRGKTLALDVTGNIILGEKSTLDISVNSKSKQAKDILALFDAQLGSFSKEVELNGELSVNARIKGAISNKLSPAINASVQLKNGQGYLKKSKLRLDKIELSGKFTNGKHRNAKSSRIDIEHLVLAAGTSNATLNGALSNLKSPWIRLNAKTKIDLTELKQYFAKTSFEQLSGKVSGDFTLKGSLNYALKDKNYWLKMPHSGNFTLEKVCFTLPENPYTGQNINANIRLNNTQLESTKLNGSISGTQFSFIGKVSQLPQILIGQQRILTVNGDASVAYLDLDKWIKLLETPDKKEEKSTPWLTHISLNTQVNKLKYDKINAENINTQLIYKENGLVLSNLSMNAFDGDLAGNAQYVNKSAESTLLKTKLDFNTVDLKKLFYSFNNFGIDNLSYQQLEGKATGSFDTEMLFHKGKLITPSIDLLGHLEINQGRLKQYEPAMQLADFTGIKDFYDLHFSRLSNDFMISNNVLHIPGMDINSNAFDVGLSGQQKLDGDFTYHIQLLLADLTLGKTRRLQKEQSQYGEVEQDGDGKTSLFLLAESQKGKTKVSLDKKAMGKKIKKSFGEQKQELKQMLNQEHGWFANDTTLKKKPQKKKPAFEVEWEDE